MVLFKKAADLRQYLHSQAAPAGFVPTMGALHAGHRSLIEAAKKDGLLVVCSIFVNPTQFNDRQDFEKYPVSPEEDIALLLEAGCDVLFMPDEQEIYPQGSGQSTTYDFDELDHILEGASRPGHFRGVGQVVSRLLEIVRPRYLYLGQKDFQQCIVIRKLLKMMHLEEEIGLVICPTMREPDGLAMSSRNRRLTEPQRALAGIIYQCLISIQTKQHSARFGVVRKECVELLEEKGFQPEYVALADARTLELLPDYDGNKNTVALIAARLGNVRLIDSMPLN